MDYLSRGDVQRREPRRGLPVEAPRMTVPPKKPIIGWREWAALPALGIPAMKVKVDTGARTSALHAYAIRVHDSSAIFRVHPIQRDTRTVVECRADLMDYREVRSSTGRPTRRPVIRTEIELFGDRWPVELTLVSRARMGFRMLLGRQAIRGRFVVDPGLSFLAGAPRPLGERERAR